MADFAVFRVFGGISRDFAEIPEFRGSATARNIRSPDITTNHVITCTNTMVSCINMLPALNMTTVFCLNDIII